MKVYKNIYKNINFQLLLGGILGEVWQELKPHEYYSLRQEWAHPVSHLFSSVTPSVTNSILYSLCYPAFQFNLQSCTWLYSPKSLPVTYVSEALTKPKYSFVIN